MSIDNNIFCLGDGYAHGHIWPEWPQILQALLPSKHIKTISGVGAGPEFLITQLINADPVCADVIIQWPNLARLDKLIEDDSWLQKAKDDPVYFFNLYPTAQGTWWLSSESADQTVRLYHRDIIQPEQRKIRHSVYKKLVVGYLKSKNCRYLETDNLEQESYLKKYPTLRGNEIQPSPIAHFYFVTELLVPKLGYQIDRQIQDKLENLIRFQEWKPYDPDRAEIWEKIVKELAQ